MRYQGKITNWKDDQGFGFVTQNGTGEKAFVHIKSFPLRTKRPIEGDQITYELVVDEKRRLRADHIRFVGVKLSSTQNKVSQFGIVFTVIFCGFLIFSINIGKLSLAVLGVYLATSTIAFISYALDKFAAQNNNWRTPEITLHMFGLFGGWPGALLAQKILRHKSQKQEFQTVFWATVIINCAVLGLFFTDKGLDIAIKFLYSVGSILPK